MTVPFQFAGTVICHLWPSGKTPLNSVSGRCAWPNAAPANIANDAAVSAVAKTFLIALSFFFTSTQAKSSLEFKSQDQPAR